VKDQRLLDRSRRLALAGEGTALERARGLCRAAARILITRVEGGRPHYQEAVELLRLATRLLRAEVGRSHPLMAMAHWLLGEALLCGGRPGDAARALIEALSIGEAARWRPGCPCDNIVCDDLMACAQRLADGSLLEWARARRHEKGYCSCYRMTMWPGVRLESESVERVAGIPLPPGLQDLPSRQ